MHIRTPLILFFVLIFLVACFAQLAGTDDSILNSQENSAGEPTLDQSSATLTQKEDSPWIEIPVVKNCVSTAYSINDLEIQGSIVVSERTKGNFSILSLETGELVNITDEDEHSQFQAYISPDGNRLVYRTHEEEGADRLNIITFDPANKISFEWKEDDWFSLAGWFNDEYILIRPDSEKMVFFYDPVSDAGYSIDLMFADAFPFEDVWQNSLNVSISPDLSKAVYPLHQSSGVGLVELDSRVQQTTIPEVIRNVTPQWSRDSNEIALALYSPDYPTNPDHSTLGIFSLTGGLQQYLPSEDLGVIHTFSWSPNGDRIAFWMMRELEHETLYIFERDEQRVIDTCINSEIAGLDANFPVWSADGENLAIAVLSSEANGLEVSNLIILNMSEDIAVSLDVQARPIGWLTDGE